MVLQAISQSQLGGHVVQFLGQVDDPVDLFQQTLLMHGFDFFFSKATPVPSCKVACLNSDKLSNFFVTF